jgi:dTMP kinase
VTVGRFITFEGGEGTGKSTQIQLLADHLREIGIPCIVTREPGGTADAEQIRELLVTGEPDRWTAMSELCLINAARAEHVEHLISPALEQGTWVLCDRFIDSTKVYQGFAKGISYDVINAMHTLTTNGMLPELTIVLDLPTVEAFERISMRGSHENRFESHDDLFHYRVADAFRVIAREGDRFILIDGSGSVDVVKDRIWDAVTRWFSVGRRART